MHELILKIRAFRDARDWDKIQSIKDLLLGINIEVGELQSIFLWMDEIQINDIHKNNDLKTSASYEIADILIFLVYLSDKLNIDLEKATEDKLKIHELHYPVNKSKGNKTKYTKL